MTGRRSAVVESTTCPTCRKRKLVVAYVRSPSGTQNTAILLCDRDLSQTYMPFVTPIKVVRWKSWRHITSESVLVDRSEAA